MKDITSITKTTEAPSSSTNIYIEDGGNFRRSSLEHMKETLGINEADEAIDAESKRAQDAESGLSARISQNATDIATEVSRAEDAESGLSDRITENGNAISAEATRAKAAEDTLTKNLSAEATRATAAESANASNISALQTSFNNLWTVVHTW